MHTETHFVIFPLRHLPAKAGQGTVLRARSCSLSFRSGMETLFLWKRGSKKPLTLHRVCFQMSCSLQPSLQSAAAPFIARRLQPRRSAGSVWIERDVQGGLLSKLLLKQVRHRCHAAFLRIFVGILQGWRPQNFWETHCLTVLTVKKPFATYHNCSCLVHDSILSLLPLCTPGEPGCISVTCLEGLRATMRFP